MTYKTRMAAEEDVGEILTLMKRLSADNKIPSERFAVDEKILKRSMRDSVVFCHLLELDSRTVGYTLSYFRYSTWRGREIYVEDVFVTENHRIVENYKLLLKCVGNYGRVIGCNTLMTACRGDDVKMKDFCDMGAQDLTRDEEFYYFRIDDKLNY